MAKSDASEAIAAAEPAAPALPLFYRRPMALAPELHFGLALKTPGHYGFAREANAIPLNASEFTFAARHYPIVFTATEPVTPVAVVGLASTRRNLFVDAEGRWRPGVYVPAYVRRYPFIFIEDKRKKEFTLAIDEGAGLLEERPGPEDKLFWEGKPTELVQRALAFCSEYQANVDLTRRFCAAVEEEKLFSDKEAGIALNDGRKFRLTGFRMIEETRFEKLPGREFLKLRRRRFLNSIYLHLLSMANWAGLADLAAEYGE